MSEVTRILSAIEQGDPSAAGQLLPLVYDELRRLAAQKLACERPGRRRGLPNPRLRRPQTGVGPAAADEDVTAGAAARHVGLVVAHQDVVPGPPVTFSMELRPPATPA